MEANTHQRRERSAPAEIDVVSGRYLDTTCSGQRRRPGDRLSIQVEGERELSGELVVSREGKFAFPLVGSVEVAGRRQAR